MEMTFYSRKHARAATKGTKWENLIHFWETGIDVQPVVFSEEINAAKLLQLDKKIPEFILLG